MFPATALTVRNILNLAKTSAISKREKKIGKKLLFRFLSAFK